VNGDGYGDVLIGSAQSSVGANSSVGRVRLYLGSASGVQPALSTTVTTIDGPDGAGGRFGDALASGDLNGDGYCDVLICAPIAEAAHVYFGSASGLRTDVASITSIPNPDGVGSRFGISAATSDVNGDGYADLIIGADLVNNKTGRAHVYLGGASGVTPLIPSNVIHVNGPDGQSSYFGEGIARAGDINGDGYGDVLIGAPGVAVGPDGGMAPNVGRVHAYLGGMTGLEPSNSAKAINIDGVAGSGALFGLSNGSAGDVDRDGYADILLAAPGEAIAFGDAGTIPAGRVHLYHGTPTGPTPQDQGTIVVLDSPDAAQTQFGISLACY
jgi:hypothetical protein